MPAEGEIDVGPVRICVVTNGNFYAAVALRELLETGHVHTVITTTGSSGSSRRIGLGMARRWGWRLTIFKGATGVVVPMLSRLFRLPWSVKSLAAHHGVRTLAIDDLNTEAGLELLREIDPTLLVSVSCPYVLRSEVLAVAPVSINLHSGLLPAYAGVSTYLHALANNEREIGVTVHEMVPRVDAGDILDQSVVQVGPEESVFSVLLRAFVVGGASLAAIAHTPANVTRHAQDLRARTYFAEPTAADVRACRANGHPLMRSAEMATLLRRMVTRTDPVGTRHPD